MNESAPKDLNSVTTVRDLIQSVVTRIMKIPQHDYETLNEDYSDDLYEHDYIDLRE